MTNMQASVSGIEIWQTSLEMTSNKHNPPLQAIENRENWSKETRTQTVKYV